MYSPTLAILHAINRHPSRYEIWLDKRDRMRIPVFLLVEVQSGLCIQTVIIYSIIYACRSQLDNRDISISDGRITKVRLYGLFDRLMSQNMLWLLLNSTVHHSQATKLTTVPCINDSKLCSISAISKPSFIKKNNNKEL